MLHLYRRYGFTPWYVQLFTYTERQQSVTTQEEVRDARRHCPQSLASNGCPSRVRRRFRSVARYLYLLYLL